MINEEFFFAFIFFITILLFLFRPFFLSRHSGFSSRGTVLIRSNDSLLRWHFKMRGEVDIVLVMRNGRGCRNASIALWWWRRSAIAIPHGRLHVRAKCGEGKPGSAAPGLSLATISLPQMRHLFLHKGLQVHAPREEKAKQHRANQGRDLPAPRGGAGEEEKIFEQVTQGERLCKQHECGE